jgi:hypothetical protein
MYSNKSVDNGNVTLDYDVTSGLGPETMTVTAHDEIRGVYFVHDYSQAGFQAGNTAQVNIWSPDCSVQRLSVSNANGYPGASNYWEAFTFRQTADGAMTFTPSNRLMTAESAAPACP